MHFFDSFNEQQFTTQQLENLNRLTIEQVKGVQQPSQHMTSERRCMNVILTF